MWRRSATLPPLVLVFIFYYFVIDQLMPLLGIEAFIRPVAAACAQTALAWVAARPAC